MTGLRGFVFRGPAAWAIGNVHQCPLFQKGDPASLVEMGRSCVVGRKSCEGWARVIWQIREAWGRTRCCGGSGWWGESSSARRIANRSAVLNQGCVCQYRKSQVTPIKGVPGMLEDAGHVPREKAGFEPGRRVWTVAGLTGFRLTREAGRMMSVATSSFIVRKDLLSRCRE